jgi:hypothetical protein
MELFNKGDKSQWKDLAENFRAGIRKEIVAIVSTNLDTRE